ncbi:MULTISPECIES: hypothetical protein [unclassified Ochrobactrum]|jgi:hypothetical protein|uniref:Nmad2 family putative nucleotide modification protein n=1 Tax=unclassified Ochrobactrum TaxID=239106 RepID=UPI00256FD97C|nr:MULTISPECIES: hypothetical protein [unclassified Ochrobactrum]
MSIYSYIVRYDSGFAPNPFYGFCTLATCKPLIRKHAKIGDWVVGCGSADRAVRRGGHLVHAMRVTETLTFQEYDADARFQRKKPIRNGSRKQSAGDNIYFTVTGTDGWSQRDSFHSNSEGLPNPRHVANDTQVDRVLVSNHFIYFGGEGPTFPDDLLDSKGRHICKDGIGRSKFEDAAMETRLIGWLGSIGPMGLRGSPFEWSTLR